MVDDLRNETLTELKQVGVKEKGIFRLGIPKSKTKKYLKIFCQVDNDWWAGVLRGVRGMFPANFVQVISVKILLGTALHG